MSWFILALIPPFLWSITNLLDKIVLSKYFKGIGVGSILIFISVVNLILIPLIVVFNRHLFDLSFIEILTLFLMGALGTIEFLLYFKALSEEDASTVVPLFQLIPVLTYVFAYIFLHETLNSHQILASSIIILGTILISLNLDGRIPKIKNNVLLLMTIACLIIAIQATVFKLIAVKTDYWRSIFWMYLGGGITALFIVFMVQSYWKEAIQVVKTNSKNVITLMTISELTNMAGGLIINYAFLLAPVTLVYVVNGFQPIFVLMESILLSIFQPHIYKESLLKKHLMQKVVAIVIIFFGTYLLNI